MRETRNTRKSGSGYICELSRAKSRAIKTPLKFYIEYNNKVNACKSLEELKTLINNNK